MDTPFHRAMALVPIVAIVRQPDSAAAVPVASAVHAGGIRLIEITLTTDGALNAVGRMREQGPSGLCVGVGSVRTGDDAKRAIDAGSEYVVTPTFRPPVLEITRAAGIPVVCGGFTPTELDAAQHAGADYVKLFPASSVGARYVRELLAPMPDLRIVPTGGVNATTIPEYRAAGAVGVGVGSALVDDATVEAQDWDEIERRARQLFAAWRS